MGWHNGHFCSRVASIYFNDILFGKDWKKCDNNELDFLDNRKIAVPLKLFKRVDLPYHVITVEQFREKIRAKEFDFLLDSVLLGEVAEHVSISDTEYIQATLASKFSVPANLIEVRIVGSAKVGFAITEKRLRDGKILPRYRQFSAYSDIDVAVVSTALFDLIWNELSAYAHRVPRLPWNSGLLGDYLVHGWLRPDYFPNSVRLRRCDDWWDLFRILSADARYGRRKVRGGLFHSVTHMRRYQARAIQECAIAESLTL